MGAFRLLGLSFLSFALGWAAPVLAQTAEPATASATPPALHLQVPMEVLAQDAGEYVRQFGVPLDEAMRRLRAQEESATVTARLQAIYRDRLAGVVIEHRPAWRIVFLLTGEEPVPEQRIYAGGMNVPILFRTGARATRQQLVDTIQHYQPAIRDLLPSSQGLGADPRTAALVVLMRAKHAEGQDLDALSAQLEALTGVPVRIHIRERQDINASIHGGSRVVGLLRDNGRTAACTTGFVVTDGTRTGIATAAHCPDELRYRDAGGAMLPLALVGKWGTRHQDVQVNVAEAGASFLPLFRPDPRVAAARPLTAARSRDATRAGEFLCHSGARSGYSCALVELVDFAPHPHVCGALCDPAWVTVAGPSCGSGDSGGPVFSLTTAFGLSKGLSRGTDGECGFYFYMSTDYLPPGWSLLLDGEKPALPAPTTTAAISSGGEAHQ